MYRHVLIATDLLPTSVPPKNHRFGWALRHVKTGPIERVTVGLLITCLANIPPARWLAERSAGARIALRTNSI